MPAKKRINFNAYRDMPEEHTDDEHGGGFFDDVGSFVKGAVNTVADIAEPVAKIVQVGLPIAKTLMGGSLGKHPSKITNDDMMNLIHCRLSRLEYALNLPPISAQEYKQWLAKHSKQIKGSGYSIGGDVDEYGSGYNVGGKYVVGGRYDVAGSLDEHGGAYYIAGSAKSKKPNVLLNNNMPVNLTTRKTIEPQQRNRVANEQLDYMRRITDNNAQKRMAPSDYM